MGRGKRERKRQAANDGCIIPKFTTVDDWSSLQPQIPMPLSLGTSGGGAEPASGLAQLRGEEAGRPMGTSSPVAGGGIHPTLQLTEPQVFSARSPGVQRNPEAQVSNLRSTRQDPLGRGRKY